MKDKKLLFDRKCHVLYSKPCKKEIRAKIALHYPEAEREAIWEKVQRQYADFLSDWRTDLGGKRNFHNGVGGTYDCIAIMSYYTVCKAVTSTVLRTSCPPCAMWTMRPWSCSTQGWCGRPPVWTAVDVTIPSAAIKTRI